MVLLARPEPPGQQALMARLEQMEQRGLLALMGQMELMELMAQLVLPEQLEPRGQRGPLAQTVRMAAAAAAVGT